MCQYRLWSRRKWKWFYHFLLDFPKLWQFVFSLRNFAVHTCDSIMQWWFSFHEIQIYFLFKHLFFILFLLHDESFLLSTLAQLLLSSAKSHTCRSMLNRNQPESASERVRHDNILLLCEWDRERIWNFTLSIKLVKCLCCASRKCLDAWNQQFAISQTPTYYKCASLSLLVHIICARCSTCLWQNET